MRIEALVTKFAVVSPDGDVLGLFRSREQAEVFGERVWALRVKWFREARERDEQEAGRGLPEGAR